MNLDLGELNCDVIRNIESIRNKMSTQFCVDLFIKKVLIQIVVADTKNTLPVLFGRVFF